MTVTVVSFIGVLAVPLAFIQLGGKDEGTSPSSRLRMIVPRSFWLPTAERLIS